MSKNMKSKGRVHREAYINAIVEGWRAEDKKRRDDWLFEAKMESLGVEVKPC